MVMLKQAATPDDLSLIDVFCGAGGSSQGIRDAGVDVKVALNHWQLAIQTHSANFPNTLHEVANVSLMDPRRYPRTRIAWFSPECTNHSLAKGVTRRKQQADLWGDYNPDPAAERSRATMWDVCRFVEWAKYDMVLVENVVDARLWVMWDAWILAMKSMGYDYRCVYLNSMHAHPTPQSRDRMYVVFWRHGLPEPDLEPRPVAWCPRCEAQIAAVQSWKNPQRRWGRYRAQYVFRCPRCAERVEPYYYCAANAIDWSLPVQRIGDRKHPLKERTLARIQAGLEKFGREPTSLTTNAALLAGNPHPLLRNLYASAGMALSPFVLAPGSYGKPQSVIERALPTQATLATPMMIVPPFLIDSGGVWESGALNMLGAPYPTQSTRRQPGMVLPFVVEVGHGGPENNARVRSAADALPTQHTLGGSGVVFAPLIVPLDHQQGEKPARSGYEPMPTQTTRQEVGFALAPFLAELHGTSGTRAIDEALGCVTAGGNHHGLVEPPPFLLSYYGEGGNVHAIEEALGTQTARDRHALVRPTGELPAVEDCGFRVLKPHEIQRAMAFADDYVVLGTARDRVKQLGNAVTPPAARWLIQQCRHVLER